jgi:hypothetical protein
MIRNLEVSDLSLSFEERKHHALYGVLESFEFLF